MVDAGDGGARDAEPPPPIDAGRDAGSATPCRFDGTCAGEVCRRDRGALAEDLAPLPLVCGPLSAGSPPGGECRVAEDCDRGICSLPGACVRACRTLADCDSGERCIPTWVRTSGETMQPLDACVPRFAVPEDVVVEAPVALRGLNSLDFVTDIIDDPAPSSLIVWEADRDTTPFFLYVDRLSPPEDRVYDATRFGPDVPAPDWSARATTVSSLATLLYPNGPRTPESPLGFAVSLGAFSDTDAERYTLRRDGEHTRLELDLYLVGGLGLSSPDGELPRELGPVLDDLREVLTSSGISIEAVRVHDVVGRLRGRFSVLDDVGGIGVPEDLPALYRLSAGASRPSVHVFLVRLIDGALGIASGIPGPHGMPGNGASGVAIALEVIPRFRVGEVIAHEIGHFLGLSHTTEMDGSVNDPFDDTPECRLDRDLDGDGIVSRAECADAGADNLMFWAGGDVISPQQGTVMRHGFMLR